MTVDFSYLTEIVRVSHCETKCFSKKNRLFLTVKHFVSYCKTKRYGMIAGNLKTADKVNRRLKWRRIVFESEEIGEQNDYQAL